MWINSFCDYSKQGFTSLPSCERIMGIGGGGRKLQKEEVREGGSDK